MEKGKILAILLIFLIAIFFGFYFTNSDNSINSNVSYSPFDRPNPCPSGSPVGSHACTAIGYGSDFDKCCMPDENCRTNCEDWDPDGNCVMALPSCVTLNPVCNEPGYVACTGGNTWCCYDPNIQSCTHGENGLPICTLP